MLTSPRWTVRDLVRPALAPNPRTDTPPLPLTRLPYQHAGQGPDFGQKPVALAFLPRHVQA